MSHLFYIFLTSFHHVQPSTTRLKEIVHRTAKFLLTQPPQMEITIQVKQSSNPDFNFLRKDDILHPYYKHVKWLMSSGMWEYQNEEENVSEGKKDGEYDNGDVGRRREKGGVIKPDMDDRKRKRPQVEATR
ncbi:hypothetical protein BKA69DRAFT_1078623 [Paraphysoderma sedebokerense]|nr:hypothetical protein BKA69DRAFT_1078623 [Paraphysoderma sedebokerense]